MWQRWEKKTKRISFFQQRAPPLNQKTPQLSFPKMKDVEVRVVASELGVVRTVALEQGVAGESAGRLYSKNLNATSLEHMNVIV